MDKYEIRRGSISDLDLIKPLWEKLNNIHENLSPDFKERFGKMNWETRKNKLLLKSCKIMFDYVIEVESQSIIGYCVCSIEKNNEKTGEIDSVFIEENHRKSGVGAKLMDNAINWLIQEKTEIQKLIVGVGNEDVLDFYKQFDFYPLHIVLQRKETK